jgi:putative NIF3 family GTP cyclohydrolase 1 type 2
MHMAAREIAEEFEKIAPLKSGNPDDELGFIWGDSETEVHAIGCLWCATASSIQRCIDLKIQMIICHEELWLRLQISTWYEGPEKANIYSNVKRRELLQKHELVVYRSHSSWDALRGDGILDSAIAALKIDGLRTVARKKCFWGAQVARTDDGGAALKASGQFSRI